MRTKLLDFYDNLSASFYASGQLGETVSVLKIVSIVVSGLLTLIAIFLVYKMRKNIDRSLDRVEESISAAGLPKRVFDERWDAVQDKMELEDESAWKLAVIEGDKILDDILKRVGYQGGDMGERLKQITSTQLSNIEEVWQAHKMRNNIVHDPGHQINKSQAKRAIEIYQKALEDLEAV